MQRDATNIHTYTSCAVSTSNHCGHGRVTITGILHCSAQRLNGNRFLSRRGSIIYNYTCKTFAKTLITAVTVAEEHNGLRRRIFRRFVHTTAIFPLVLIKYRFYNMCVQGNCFICFSSNLAILMMYYPVWQFVPGIQFKLLKE